MAFGFGQTLHSILLGKGYKSDAALMGLFQEILSLRPVLVPTKKSPDILVLICVILRQ